MFIRKQNEQSVNDFVEKEAAKEAKHKSIADQLFEQEMADLGASHNNMLDQKAPPETVVTIAKARKKARVDIEAAAHIGTH